MPRASPSVRRINHVSNICSMWGNFHFKTFDGDIYQYKGTCEYNLVSDCNGPVQGFSVHVKRAGIPGISQITRVLVTIGDIGIELTKKLVMVNNDIVKLPHYVAGVMLEENSIYIKLYAKLGLSVTWNKDDTVTLEMDAKYSNHTCGLCGDYSGVPFNEFLSDGRVIGFIEFGNKHRIYSPNDICEDPYEEFPNEANTVDNCQSYREDCSELLLDESWSLCRNLLSPEPYIHACMMDMCAGRPGDTDDTASLCSTLSEYSHQCSHAGGKPPNWRTPTFCAMTCPFNMEYSESGSPCLDTCTRTHTSSLCEEHKTDGCFCPSGTVFDDISERGCIPQEQCQCKHNKVYNTGEVLLKDDEECVCQQGRWICKSLSLTGVCAIGEGSHFTTFDGKEFSFHGNCYYVLSKACVDSKFIILGQLIPCVAHHTDTCLKSVALLLNNDKSNALIIKDDGIIRHNGDIKLPYTTAEFTIFRPSSFYIMLQTTFGLHIHVQLVPVMQLYITLDKSFHSKTCGLCGNFNMVLSDELMTPQGAVEGTATSFANSWKAQSNCPDQIERFDDPCSYSIDSESYAEHWCSKLRDKKEIFAQCHSTVNPESYYKRCKYSSCTCEKSEDCLCAVFSSYVWACAAKGVFLEQWRDTVCAKYTKSCPASQTFNYNVHHCQHTCDSLSLERQGCSTDYVPVDGCTCPAGLYESVNGACVPMDKCPCYHNGEHIKPGKSINIKNDHCICTNGKLQCQSWRPRITDCPASKVFFNCSTAGLEEHGLECAQTCAQKNADCYLADCESGCKCPAGLLDDGRGNCVKEHECPCKHDNHFYAPGSQIMKKCNKCICKHGKFDCTNYKCPGTCTIYGSGHYNTFDEQRYDFSGFCSYIAVQNNCGNKTSTFHVITENMPCGTTGTSCSKAVRIILGRTELELRDGKMTEIKAETGLSIKFNVRYVGLYLVIESEIGITVLWDFKTTVRIILQPHHMGEVCGLCGNFNGNGKDDFTTQDSLHVSDVLEFVNSWKLDNSCPGANPDFDPCFHAQNRHTWAKLQCSIIKSDTFKECHNKVEWMPYFDNCVKDSCSCDTGGDCECFCTAVAAYAQACNEAGVCVAWRSPEICPVFCDYYNHLNECIWHYSPCETLCYSTCLNPSGNCTNPLPHLEGCYPKCPPTKPIFDEKNQVCVEKCPGCFINGTEYTPGEEIPTKIPCNKWGHGGLMVSTFASHLQGWGFDSRLRRVCGVCMFSPCLWGFLQENEIFEICNCTLARCIENNTFEIVPYECPPLQNITCSNRKPTVLVPDEYHCCEQRACDCFCEGWGDPHYITFDGLFYSHQGECTYVLMQEISPKHHLKIYIDNVNCDPQESVSCPRSIIVSYNNLVITLKNHNLIGAAKLEALLGNSIMKLPYQQNGLRVLSSGLNLILEIPKLNAVVMFGVTGFSVNLPFQYFGNNTQGHCGTCNNNMKDDCMLPGGKLVDDCALMANYWQAKDLYNPECKPPPSDLVTAAPTKAPCPINTVCELLKSNLFKECHPHLSPENYFAGCQFDSCHTSNPAVVCTSVQTYAIACSQAGICINWRNHTDLCTAECPADKVYQPCGPADPPTCKDKPEDHFLNMTTEGCFCPDGMQFFSKESGVCVDKCGCLDPSGQGREFGEEFQYGCQDCVCDEGSVSIICKPKQCSNNSNQLTCSDPGFIMVNVTDPSDACCTILTCSCESSTCPSVNASCSTGYTPVFKVPEGKCCLEYTCEPKSVCVHKGQEYEPGTSIPVINCQECHCTWDVDPNSQLYKVQCGMVTCNEKCEPGYSYVESDTDECCGKCMKTKCVLNYNGTVQILENGAEWTPSTDACDKFICTMTDGEYVTTNYKVQCPPFNISNCQPGTVQLSANRCCQVCVDMDNGCKVQTTIDYITYNRCRSKSRMEKTHCQGHCNSYSKYTELDSSSCSCCQASRTSKRKVSLDCPAHNGQVCSTWGNFHFSTFDGDFFQLPYACNYILTTMCESTRSDFNIQMRREYIGGVPTIRSFNVKLEGTVIMLHEGNITMDNEVLTIPGYYNGIRVEKMTNYIKISSKLGLTVFWDEDNSLSIEIAKDYMNQTCGLCGDFNGIMQNEFIENGQQLPPEEFAIKWKMDAPTETCEQKQVNSPESCQNQTDLCQELLYHPSFKSCHNLLPTYVYLKACVKDLCQCNSSQNVCLCDTISEFSRQCAHAGGKPGNWRSDEFCATKCPSSMVHSECGNPCTDTCSNQEGSKICADHCLDGCVCPPGTVLDDIAQTGCISVDECACTHNGKSYQPGESFKRTCQECVCSKGRWKCISLDCPGTCSLLGGSHIITYDGKAYSFQGNCDYILSKDNSSDVTVLVHLARCGLAEGETCLTSVKFIISSYSDRLKTGTER
ncbi:hypothetical protein QTP70_022761 [Hemibagrus guttatus]|uniref:Mucin-2 n=1 Tax=Hemibagrus guttatus TaxID=175788 RepID=A0AAE0UZZ5_9TELE|nr:hypothetical protein QTP70_022761 [Hemibagrus guttatus]